MRVPSQVNEVGALVITGALGVNVSPQSLVTVGNVVGATAKAGHATVAAPLAGTVNGARSIV